MAAQEVVHGADTAGDGPGTCAEYVGEPSEMTTPTRVPEEQHPRGDIAPRRDDSDVVLQKSPLRR